MLWHIYLRRGQVFVPTVSRTDAGFFLDVNPVAVHKSDDFEGIANAIVASISRGNPVTVAPNRGSFPAPVILEHAKVKSWSTFEKSATCWKVRLKESLYQLCPMRRNSAGGWEDDLSKIEIHSDARSLAHRISELIRQVD